MAQQVVAEFPAQNTLKDIEDFCAKLREHGAGDRASFKIGLSDDSDEETLRFEFRVVMPRDAKRFNQPRGKHAARAPQVEEAVEERKAKREAGETVPGHVKPAAKKPPVKKKTTPRRKPAPKKKVQASE